MKAYLAYMNKENAKDNKSLGGTDNALTEAFDVDPLETLDEISQGKLGRYVNGVKKEVDDGKIKARTRKSGNRLTGVARAMSKTAERDLRKQGFGKQGLAKVPATNEEVIDEGKRWDRLKKAAFQTPSSSQGMGNGPMGVAKIIKEPVGKAIWGASALGTAGLFHDPHLAVAGAAMLGAAGVHKGLRMAKRYKQLKDMGEDTTLDDTISALIEEGYSDEDILAILNEGFSFRGAGGVRKPVLGNKGSRHIVSNSGKTKWSSDEGGDIDPPSGKTMRMLRPRKTTMESVDHGEPKNFLGMGKKTEIRRDRSYRPVSNPTLVTRRAAESGAKTTTDYTHSHVRKKSVAARILSKLKWR